VTATPGSPFEAAVARSAEAIRARAGGTVPGVAILLGSGWGGVAGALVDAREVAYRDLPAFPELAVGGHAGALRIGTLAGRRVIALAGRKHAYETGDSAAMKGAIRALAAAGVRVLVQTNAAGSLHPSMPPGALMRITDHLNLPQRSPLVGETGDARFVDMADAYDPALGDMATQAARAEGIELHAGVYAWVLGPQFETPAEIRMLRALGADAVGMSTVPETIVARHAGLRVLALSMITNLACGLSDEKLSHAHTLQVAAEAGARGARLVAAIVAALPG
jgi:purine-nucleoside phosphorylase